MTAATELLRHFPSDAEIECDAVIRGDADEYRYQLSRIWCRAKGLCLWVMLNPSTADAKVNDATIRKCMRFAFLWGHGGILVCNLFGYRSRDPKPLAKLAREVAVGPENDEWIMRSARAANRIVLGWGTQTYTAHRALTVPDMLRRSATELWTPECLGHTQSGAPKHPLMLAYVTPLEPFRRL